MPERRKWTLVGSESLLGRELRDLVAEGRLPVDLQLISEDPARTGVLTEQSGDPAVVMGLDAAALRARDVVFLAGSTDSAQQVLDMPDAPVIIDLTHVSEDHARSLIRAPYVEPASFQAPPDAVHSIAHPAAIALAIVLQRIHQQHPLKRSIVHVFEPASERGTAGVEELQQQTVSLLSFKGMPKKVYDAQLSFNMLARYGEEAPFALETAELRIERHLATLFSRAGTPAPPLPSLRLIQAPVFHGYSLSLWIEFTENPGVEALESALSDGRIDVRRSDFEPPHSAGIAGQSGVAIGAMALDRNAPQAVWCWLVADNLRLAAENAVAAGSQLL